MKKPKLSVWEGCYDKSLKGFISEASFTHPAKMSLGLCERIFDHCLERGYFKRGDVIGECFLGIATVALVGAYRGLKVIGVELEKKFYDLAQANIALHKSKLEALGRPLPVIIQGDSRKFHEHLEAVTQFRADDCPASAVVSSPPYADSIDRPSGIDPDKVKKPGGPNCQTHHDIYGQTPGQIGRLKAGEVAGVISSPPFTQTPGGAKGINVEGYNGRSDISPDFLGSRTYQGQGGDRTEGNIETLKPGDIQAVISSPPYSDIAAGAGGLNTKPASKPGQQSGRKAESASQDTDQRYGQSEGQISQLKGGSVEAVVSSPPFRDARSDTTKSQATKHGGPCAERHETTQAGAGYGQENGQIDNLPTGDVHAVVSSPPWESNSEGVMKASKFKDPMAFAKGQQHKGHYASPAAKLRCMERDDERDTYGDSPGQIGKERGAKETCHVCGECLPSAICVTVKIAASKLAKTAGGASNITDSTSGAREEKKQRSTSARSRSDISIFQTHSTTESTTENGKAGITDGADLLGESSDVKPLSATGISAANAERNPTSLFTIKKPQPKPAGNGTTSFQILQRFAELATTGTTQKQWSENIRCCAKCAESLTSLAVQFPALALSSAGPLSTQRSTDDGKPEDYWRAMAKVYRSCHTAIKPGGVIVLVLKNYVKDGKIVPLCDDTCKLLEHLGFTVIERIHAMLVKETRHEDLFNGHTVQTKSRKSFFRRLAEKNGSPKIDFEEVLIALRPL